MKRPSVTECGIPGVGRVPADFHFCNFYRNRQELLESVAPYFATGLRNRERCIWLTADPVRADEAWKELGKVVPGLDVLVQIGQMEFRDAESWYRQHDADQIIDVWLAEEQRALDAGYEGLRIAGNTSFVTREMWPRFMAYEEAAGKAFLGRRITALCSYRLSQCGATDVFEAACRHQAALEPTADTSWVLLAAR